MSRTGCVRRPTWISAAIAGLVAAIVGDGVASAQEGVGHVELANSGAPEAQADFARGLAQLHNFEYEEAANAFRLAQTVDAGFALAYWGEAMTFNHPIWMEQDLEAARAALGKLGTTADERRKRAATERERAFLDAIEILYGEGTKLERDRGYAVVMGRIHESDPGDVDAAAFAALALLGTAHGGRDASTYMRAAALLEEYAPRFPEHPGIVHYSIHCYDDPIHAPLGLRAARAYAEIAPAAAHAQHMTSHIFLALGMWKETVEANVAAIAALNRSRSEQGLSPRSCGHYASWLAYSYLQQGRFEEGRVVLGRCRESVSVRSAPAPASESLDPDSSPIASLANMRLRYALESGEWESEIVAAPLPADAGVGARLDESFARALGALSGGRIEEARAALVALEAVAREAVELEERKGDPDPSYRGRAEIVVLETRALLTEQEGDLAGAEQLLRQAVATEGSLPVAFGPPLVDKPSHELLGEFLLRRGRRGEARAAFERALERAPGRRLSLQGLAQAAPEPGRN